MNFIKRTILSKSKSSVNISVLYANDGKISEMKEKQLTKGLQKQYEQERQRCQDIKLVPKLQAYLDLFQSFCENKNSMKKKKIEAIVSSLYFTAKSKQKQIPLLSAFSQFSEIQKLKFMIDTLKHLEQRAQSIQKQKCKTQTLLSSRSSTRSSSVDESRTRIFSQASISLNQLKALSLSYWTKAKFQFNSYKKQIIVTGKQNFIVYLQNYLVRLSKNQNYCLVLQSSNNDQVPSWLRKIYIHLKKEIFSQVFQKIWNIVISLQFQKMIISNVSVNDKKVQFSPMKDKHQDAISVCEVCEDEFQLEEGDYLVFLTSLMVKNYFANKSKLINKIEKLKFSSYKQVQFSQMQGVSKKLQKIIFCKVQGQKHRQFYQIKGFFNIPASIIKFKFIDSLKQKNKYISAWQTLQKQGESNLQAISLTFQLSTFLKQYEGIKKDFFRFKQITLKQEETNFGNNQNTQLLMLRSIEQISKTSFLNFLQVKCEQKKNSQKSQLQITCQLNQNLIKSRLKKVSKKFSKEQIAEINKEIIENFLREMIMMIFTESKIYEEKQVDQDEFYTICQSFNNQMDKQGILSTKSLKEKEQQFEMSEQDEKCQHQSQRQVQGGTKSEHRHIRKGEPLEVNYISQQRIQIDEQKDCFNLRKSQSMDENYSFEKCNSLRQNQQFGQNDFGKQYFKIKFRLSPRQKSSKPGLVKKGLLHDEWRRLDQGGMVCTNQKKIKQQKQVLKKVLTRMGQKILKQQSIMNVSLPVTIFKTESQLTTLARALTYAPLLLEPKSYTKDDSIIDYLERIKKSIVFLVTNNYAQINFQKPFNPILGQTLQSWIDGCPLYIQQISHHPQITYVYFLARGFKIYGSIQPKVSMGMNHAKVVSWCIKKIQFQNGDVIQAGPNRMVVNGTVFGQRTFNLDLKNFIYDKSHNLLAVISFGPSKKGLFSNSSQPLDYLSGNVMKMTQKFRNSEYQKWKLSLDYSLNRQWIQKQVSSFQGVWNKKITFDGVQYFDFDRQLPYQLIEQNCPLASDSRYRDDLQWLIKRNLQKSQQYKQKMQEQQRNDKKLRYKHSHTYWHTY